MSNDKKPWRSDELNDIVGDNIYHDNLVKIRRIDMSNTTNMTVEDLIDDLCQNMQEIALHADDEVYQKTNYPTLYARSNINGLFGKFEQALNALILREFEELIGGHEVPQFGADKWEHEDPITRNVFRDQLLAAAQRKYGGGK